MTDEISLAPERPEDGPLAEKLIARAFGPGRFVKAAERLREQGAPIRQLSYIAWKGGVAVGCVRLWPVTIGVTPAILLGPFAVEDAHRCTGLGAALIERACDAAAEAGHAVILLVGDGGYFSRFGFRSEPAQAVVMPGPVDQRRVLVRALRSGADVALSGPVRPAAGDCESTGQNHLRAPHLQLRRERSPTPGVPE